MNANSASLASLGGAGLMVHSGFSALYHIRDTEEESLPVSILLVLFLGLALVLLGSVASLPEFRSSRGIKQLNSMTRDEMFDRPSFRRYHHGAAKFKQAL